MIERHTIPGVHCARQMVKAALRGDERAFKLLYLIHRFSEVKTRQDARAITVITQGYEQAKAIYEEVR